MANTQPSGDPPPWPKPELGATFTAPICSAKVFVLCRGTDEQLQPAGWTANWELAKEWATANNGRYYPLDETLSPNGKGMP